MTKECFGLPALLRLDTHEVANPIGNVIDCKGRIIKQDLPA
jgi:hypothetical protein